MFFFYDFFILWQWFFLFFFSFLKLCLLILSLSFGILLLIHLRLFIFRFFLNHILILFKLLFKCNTIIPQEIFQFYQNLSLFLQLPKILPLFILSLFHLQLLKLLNRHPWRPFHFWLYQSVIKRLLITNQPPVVVYFIFILQKPLSSHFLLLWLYLLIYQILKPQVCPFLVRTFQWFEFVLALSNWVFNLGRLCYFFIFFVWFVFDLKVNFNSVKVQFSGMENIVYFICEELDLFLKVDDTHVK